MGLLSDFLLVSSDITDLEALLRHPDNALARVQARRIDPEQLENIVRVVTGTTISVPHPIAIGDDGEVFLLAVPEVLAIKLAGSTTAEQLRWAVSWSQGWDGLRSAEEKAEVCQQLFALLQSLVPLAKRACAGKERLLLWCSI